MNKKTYGQIINEMGKGVYGALDDNLREYSKIMTRDYIQQLETRVAHDSLLPAYKNKDFYVVSAFSVEPVGNKPKLVIWTRFSCPTPTYNQTVYKYHNLSASLEYLWNIPHEWTYKQLIGDPRSLKDESEAVRNMAKFCFLMESGELLNWVLRENGEKPDGIIIKKKEEDQ